MGWHCDWKFERFDGESWRLDRPLKLYGFCSWGISFLEQDDTHDPGFLVYNIVQRIAHQGFPVDSSVELAASVDRLFREAEEEVRPFPSSLCWISLKELLAFDWEHCKEFRNREREIVQDWLAALAAMNQEDTWRIINWWNPP